MCPARMAHPPLPFHSPLSGITTTVVNRVEEAVKHQLLAPATNQGDSENHDMSYDAIVKSRCRNRLYQIQAACK